MNNAEERAAEIGSGPVWRSDDRNSVLALCLLLPLLALVKIPAIGDLYVAEVCLWVVGLYATLSGRFRLSAPHVKVLGIGAAWLLSQACSDYLNGSSFADAVRGFAKIGSFLLCSVGLALLYQTFSRIVFWYLGYAVMIAATGLLAMGDQISLELGWKFGIGYAAFCLSLIAIGSKEDLRAADFSALVILFACVFGSIGFLANSRSIAAISFLASIASLFWRWRQGAAMKRTVGPMTLFGLCLAILGASYVYQWGAASGAFGVEAQDRYEAQLVGERGPLQVLLSGRPEIQVSLVAISDKPIFGHGSWARNYEYSELLNELRYVGSGELRLGTDYSELDGLIPSHSYLFGAWVEAGIVGAIFWAWILSLLLRAFALSYRSDWPMAPLMFFVILNGIWDLLFSPFGGLSKISAAALVASVCVVVDRLGPSRTVFAGRPSTARES